MGVSMVLLLSGGVALAEKDPPVKLSANYETHDVGTINVDIDDDGGYTGYYEVYWPCPGGCDSQTALPFGTSQEVADEAKRRIDQLAPGGGYVFSPIHNIQAEVPAENALTLLRVARDYGVYR